MKSFDHVIILVKSIMILLLFFLKFITNYSFVEHQTIFFNSIIIILSIILNIVLIYKKYSLKIDKRNCCFSIILSIIFIIILPFSNCIDSILFNIKFSFLLKIIYFLITVHSFFYLSLLLFNFSGNENIKNNKLRYILFFGLCFICLIFMFSTTTGIYDYDFPHLWISNGEVWSNMHTFTFNFLIYFCKFVFKSPYLIIIINTLIYIYFLYYALSFIQKYIKDKRILILFFAITIFGVVGFDQLRYLYKDVIFSMAFCILFLSIFEYFLINKLTVKIIIHIIIFSLIVLLFRHGSAYLLIIIFIVFLLHSIIKKKYNYLLFFVFVGLICFSSYRIVDYIGFNLLNGERYDKNFPYVVPIYQMASFAHNDYEFSKSDKKLIDNNFYLSIDYMKENFSKYDGDKLSRFWRLESEYSSIINNYDYKWLIKVNWHMFVDDPVYYLDSLIDFNQLLWKIHGSEVDGEEAFYLSGREDIKNYEVGIKMTSLNNYVDKFLNAFFNSPLYYFRVRGGFPLLILLISMMLLIYKKKYSLLIPLSFLFIWYMLLFISIPMSNSRYCLTFINIYPIIFCLSLGIKNIELKK